MYVLYVERQEFFCGECPFWTKLLHCEYEHAPEPTVTVKRSIRTPKDTNHGMKSMETGLLSEGIDHLGVLHQQVWACRIVLSPLVLPACLSFLLSCLKTACVCVSTVRTVLVPYRHMYVDLLSVSLLFDRMSVSVDRRLVSVCDRVE